MQFKSNLKQLLFENSITAAQLSRATGIPKNTISSWLAGSTPKNLDQIKATADYFRMSIDEVLFGSVSNREITHSPLEQYKEEINAGVFEVILRKRK